MRKTTPPTSSMMIETTPCAEKHAAWDGLSEGGTITVSLEAAPWGGEFGMFVDKFGIDWMVAVSAA